MVSASYMAILRAGGIVHWILAASMVLMEAYPLRFSILETVPHLCGSYRRR